MAITTPAMPADIASIRARNRLTLRIVTGVASMATTVNSALRTSSHTLIPSTPSR